MYRCRDPVSKSFLTDNLELLYTLKPRGIISLQRVVIVEKETLKVHIPKLMAL